MKGDTETEFYKDKGQLLKNKMTLTMIEDKKLVKKLEETMFEDPLKHIASLKADCMLNGRCPICSMILPCIHFANLDEIIERGWFRQEEWDRLNPDMKKTMTNLKQELITLDWDKPLSMIDNRRDINMYEGMD